GLEYHHRPSRGWIRRECDQAVRVIEGMFCDPMHGGNAGLIGWQLGGYPDPQMSYRDEVDSTSGSPGGPSQPAWNRSLGGLESLGKTRRANYRALTSPPGCSRSLSLNNLSAHNPKRRKRSACLIFIYESKIYNEYVMYVLKSP